MARTERRGWRWDDIGGSGHIVDGLRDAKGQCWCCSGWKRPARRSDRHGAKAALAREANDEQVSIRRRAIW